MHSSYSLTDSYMGSGKRLRYSIRKYGVYNHTKEILGIYDSRELLIEAEKQAITLEMLVDDNCLNIVEGGTGFTSDYARSCATLSNEKQSILRQNPEWVNKKAKNQSETQKKQYENGRLKKFYFDRVGLNHSTETRQLMSESSKGMGKGETNSQFGTCWITNEIENKKIKKGSEIPVGWRLGRKQK